MTKSPVLSPGGQVVGYQTVQAGPSNPLGTPVSQGGLAPNRTVTGGGAPPGLTDYQKAQLDLQRQQLAQANAINPNQQYATDAQKWIAQQQIAAQNAQNAAMIAYNRDRLALDRLLGEKNAATDANRQQQEAMQLLMTRAGRQMVAPEGNVIPSMQGPLRGGTIN
jgi:hypothetical protein